VTVQGLDRIEETLEDIAEAIENEDAEKALPPEAKEPARVAVPRPAAREKKP
jgi:hypothetical protein